MDAISLIKGNRSIAMPISRRDRKDLPKERRMKMYNITIKDKVREYQFKNETTKTALIEYIFINYWHGCHHGDRPYDGIRNQLIKRYDTIEVDKIKKTKLSWKIPVLTKGGKRKVIKVYFMEVA